MSIIEDGAGTGKKAKVNGNLRLYTNSVSISEDEQATKTGRSYNINSGIITLTDAADTPVLYLKNNEDEDLHITAIVVGLGSTDGTGIIKVTVIRNPTTGTIITSTPTDVDINSNRNYGSALTLAADAYKGATGDTMTDGEDHLILFQTASGRLFATIDELVPKGKSIGIKIDPPTGNTSMDCYAALICHLEDPNK